MTRSLFLLSLLAACSSGTEGPDAALLDAGTDAPAVMLDAGTDAPPVCTTEWDAGDVRPDLGTFMTAVHPALADVVSQGGPVLAHPQIVTVSYAGDPHAAAYEDFATFAATSSWLDAVGNEYGVGLGTAVTSLRLPGSGPATITDDALKHLIADQIVAGVLPEPVGDPNDFVYMFYFPASTQVLGMDGNAVCPMGAPASFVAGYHYEYADAVRHFAYAVVAGCNPAHTVGDYEFTASHELIEAATDPYPTLDPTWVITDQTNAWSLIFGELADFCGEKEVMSCGHRLTRVWSNAAARAGGAPCVPVPEGDPYFNTAIPTTMVQNVTAGQVLTFPLTGFSDRPISDWYVYVTPYPALSTFTPMVSSMPFTTNNGMSRMLTITVPAGTARGNFAAVYVVSSASAATATTDYNIWPIGLYLP